MNPARQAFQDELRQLLIDSWQEKQIKVSQAADRLIELARKVIRSKPDFESLAIPPQDQRPHTDEERLEVMKVKRDEILKDMRDILDSNHTIDPVHLRGAALNAYINDNFEVKYIRDTIQFLYDKMYTKK